MLIHVADGERLRLALREQGIAVRRGDTFPGLDPDWLRIAVRPARAIDQLLHGIDHLTQTRDGRA